jgi:hypothetical protein
LIEIGLIGKPNSGKSSFFKAATMIDVKISEIPFTTIEPNTGIAYVSIDCVCKEFDVKCNPKKGFCKNGKRFVPIKLIDVAGLVPGAHRGRGLGNKFLDDLRKASALINIIDTSGLTDEEGKATTNYDPSLDIEFLEKEINLWFEEIIKRALSKFKRVLTKTTKTDLIKILTEQLSGLEISESHIKETLEKTSLSNTLTFAKVLREISKPILVAANKIDLKEAQENFEKLNQKYNNIVPTSAEAEIALKTASEKNYIDYLPGDGFTIKKELTENQRRALDFIKKNVIEKFGSTGVQDCLNKVIFELLNYIAVYPVSDSNKLTDNEGDVLPDAFLVPNGTTCKELAYKIHTDIGEKFIAGIDARTKKKLPANYVLKNNDVVEIVFKK